MLYIEESNSRKSWVVGRFPSEKLYPEEGRLGDRFRDKELPGRPWVQFFTFYINYSKEGSPMPVEFWYLDPNYAE